ncbi:unnamed protein product [Nippostrongylus brasiliensis]|uniref:Uncharacterized protein n=1 Tax=Nippostrongylus brasiliensis TaxID=27835 RepID=A0A0N4Y0S2_NIPBR|nr:unnamed protein product [Nippostrongylus brasiliensis]
MVLCDFVHVSHSAVYQPLVDFSGVKYPLDFFVVRAFCRIPLLLEDGSLISHPTLYWDVVDFRPSISTVPTVNIPIRTRFFNRCRLSIGSPRVPNGELEHWSCEALTSDVQHYLSGFEPGTFYS